MSNNGATQPLSVRQMAKLLKKFGIHNGDILAIKYQSENANKEAIEIISKAFTQMGMADVIIIVVNDFNDLSVLNETAMSQRGWYRLKTLQRIMTRTPEKPEEKVEEKPESEDDYGICLHIGHLLVVS
jgi:hypothetical protein